jgi:hypothetical protein
LISDIQIQTSVIKTSNANVYDKTSAILDAIEKCSCEHCLSILKKGLVTSQDPTDVDTVTIQRNQLRDGKQ